MLSEYLVVTRFGTLRYLCRTLDMLVPSGTDAGYLGFHLVLNRALDILVRSGTVPSGVPSRALLGFTFAFQNPVGPTVPSSPLVSIR
eukprot:2069626-Rhodomonas_salina.1